MIHFLKGHEKIKSLQMLLGLNALMYLGAVPRNISLFYETSAALVLAAVGVATLFYLLKWHETELFLFFLILAIYHNPFINFYYSADALMILEVIIAITIFVLTVMLPVLRRHTYHKKHYE
jgi:hypothetical protein